MKRLEYRAPEIKLVSFEPDGTIMVEFGDGAGVGDGDILGNEAAPSSTDSFEPGFEDVDWGI